MRVLASDVLLPYLTPTKCQKSSSKYLKDDLNRLNREAAAAGTSRAALIRDRALSRLTTTEYHALVADAVAFMRGDLPRMQVETLTAYVIARLYKHPSQAVANHQPAA
jgi:hypothetical protein